MKVLACFLTTCLLTFNLLELKSQNIGTPDRDFGENGFVSLDIGKSKTNVQRIAIQHDGKILLAGSERSGVDGGFRIVRLGSRGKIDYKFGEYGKVNLPFDGELRDIKVLEDGKILLGGYIKSDANKDFVVIRLLPDGEIDSDFADAGKKIINLGGVDEGQSIFVQTDRRILIAGNTYAESWMYRDFGVARLLPEGDLDETFGDNGIKRIDVDKYDDFRDMVLQPNGKIIVAGYTKPGKFNQFAIFRLDRMGVLDSTFDGDGIKLMEAGVENSFCESLALQADGKILIAGHANPQSGKPDFDFIISRLKSNGFPDKDFGRNGALTLDLGGVEYASALHLQPDGNMLLVGSTHHKLVALRFTDVGKLDKSFGINGVQLLQNEEFTNEWASDLIVQEDGKILIAGVSNKQAILCRITGNPHLDGLENAMAFNWNKAYRNKQPATGWEVSDKFRIQAWVKDDQLTASETQQRRSYSGAKSLSPVGDFITQSMYLSIGEDYQLTILWSSADLIHFYVNGKYARTISLQLVTGEGHSGIDRVEKPLQPQKASNSLLRVERSLH